ncbi:hypothetical protein CMI37_01010 [Candidatus Pacearchaeota archaeon]|nr:hypothetical protein [Candidatus Pacearchaeota archaeon]|tara:strand:- start:864 stop:4010 length:3147 start_codon:yes stop_codon:yes gene_type:complete
MVARPDPTEITIEEALDWFGVGSTPGSSETVELATDAAPKVLKICRPELLKDSTDALRNAIGNYWELERDPDDTSTTMNPARIEMADEQRDLRDIYVRRGILDNEVIDRIEINPARITKINNSVYVPNFKIPIRLYANRDNSKGDVFWKTYFAGGSFGGESYPSLIDSTTIFYDGSFRFYDSYSTLAGKASTILNNTVPLKVREVTCNYNDYDKYVDAYQKWAADQSSELLLPNYYVMWDYHQYVTLPGREMENTEFSADTLPIAKSASYHYHFPSGSIYEGKNTNQYIGEFFIHHPRTISERRATQTLQQNIMFDQNWYHLGGPSHITAEWVGTGEALPDDLASMYNISLRFPRHKQDTDENFSYSTLEAEQAYKFRIRNIIENNNFSSKFLELLKDLDEGTITQVPLDTHAYSVETQTEPILSSTTATVDTQSYRSFDWMQFLAHAYNAYGSGLNTNYIFAGPTHTDHSTTYRDNTLYRFADNQQIVLALDQTVDLMNEYMETNAWAISDWDSYYDPGVHTGIEDITSAATAAKDHSLYFHAGGTGAQDVGETIIENILNPTIKKSEVVAYKIEKFGPVYGGSTTDQQLIQKFWMFNSANAPDIMSLIDSQIKYGENYTYNVYAYVAVMNHKYHYGDFRLTKQIGTIDYTSDDVVGTSTTGGGYGDPSGYLERTLTDDAALDGFPDLYCMQFYDPITDLTADQLFTESSTGEKDVGHDHPGGSEFADLSEIGTYSSISEFSTYATNQQDISEYPHLADFHLYLEPCIKIVEVPMFSKTLKVLDNPPNALNVNPFQFIDNSHKVGFDIASESFKSRPYPISITEDDTSLKNDYLHSKNIFPGDDVTQFSESPARYIQIYRSSTKPISFSSFRNNLVSTIDLRIPHEDFNFANYVAADKLIPNKEYYYVFRFINENGVFGPLSQIIIAELVDDGGYIFSLFDTLDSSEFTPDVFTNNTTVFKKMFQLEPNIEQLMLDYGGANLTKTATSQQDSVQVGTSASKIWDKKFKIRLTSKKTGKKLDLNVTYNIQTRDYTTTSESVLDWTSED